jgi:hypothetical protein
VEGRKREPATSDSEPQQRRLYTYNGLCHRVFVHLIHVIPEDLSELGIPPFVIKSRDLSSDVLKLSKLESTSVSKVYVEFLNGCARQCLAYEYLEWNAIDSEFTVQCMKQVPLSIVTLYVVNETLGSSNVVIPECCHADPPPSSNNVKYTHSKSTAYHSVLRTNKL